MSRGSTWGPARPHLHPTARLQLQAPPRAEAELRTEMAGRVGSTAGEVECPMAQNEASSLLLLSTRPEISSMQFI